MAFAVTSRISDTGATAGQNKTTASFTPTANSLLVVVATAQRENHTTASAWAISDSVGLTWTARPGVSTNITGNFGGDLICWTAPVGASPAAMTVTVDPWATSVTGWIGLAIFDITGHNVATPLAQAGVTNTTTSTGNTVSLTVTLGSAPSSANLVVGAFTGQNDATGAFTSISGFTELQNPTGVNDHIGVWYRTGTTTAAVTCTDLGQTVNWGAGVVLEIAAAAGGTSYDKTPADPVGITDALSVARAVARTAADPVGVSDSAARTLSAARTQADAVGVTDARTVVRTVARSQADPVGITDAVTATMARARTVADAVGVTDARSVARTVARSHGDPVGVTDSVAAVLGQAVANPVGITDTVSATMATTRTVADPVGAVDTAGAVSTGSHLELLNVFALASADPHSITITGATAGLDVWLLVNTGATVATPAGWTLEASRVATMGSYVLHLPGGSNPGGNIGVTLDLSAARPLSAVALEGPADDTSVYASLLAPVNGAGSTAWGTGAHTFTARDDVLAVYMFHEATSGAPATFSVSSYDSGFGSFADTGWAGSGVGGDEAVRVVVGSATAAGFTTGGVTLTLDAAGPTGSAVGFVAFDLDPALLAVKADPIGITDTVARVATTARTAADLVGATDARTVVAASARTVANPVGVTDAVTAVLGQLVANPVGITDARTVVRTSTRTVADTAGVTDSVSANLAGGGTNYTRTVADSVAVTDTGTPQTIDIGYTLADAAGVTDSAARAVAAARARNDAVGIVDAASSSVTGGGTNYTRTPADPVGVTDARTVARSVARSAADPVGLVDVVARQAGTARTATETVGLVDAVVVVKGKVVTIIDPAGVTDTAYVPGAAPPWSWLVSTGATLVEATPLLDGVHPATADVT